MREAKLQQIFSIFSGTRWSRRIIFCKNKSKKIF